jgi:hypothetical protein
MSAEVCGGRVSERREEREEREGREGRGGGEGKREEVPVRLVVVWKMPIALTRTHRS